MTPETTPENSVAAACDIAMGRVEPNPADGGYEVAAAHKDYNARGKCRSHWYRMVFRNGGWSYFSARALAKGTYYASDRRDTTYGTVFLGELLATHDHGGPVTKVRLVTGPEVANLVECKYATTRDGKLRVTLPNGEIVTVPNPRR